MKTAFKVIDNKNYETTSTVENVKVIRYIDDTEEELAQYGAGVSFIMVAKGVMGFRECAHLIQIAEETGCLIRLISGKKSGSTKSILSLVNLMIAPGKSLVMSIHGARNEEAFHEALKVINGETDSNDA